MVNTPERSPSAPQTVEKPSTVAQPIKKTEAMAAILLEMDDAIKESSAGQPGEQWSGAAQSSGTTTGMQTAAQGMSWRDQAIANLPTPQLMQQKLHQHIAEEIKELRKQASKITDLRRPGAAHHFNELHSRIHRLNSLLSSLFEASMEVLKRIFIRVFVDKQPIL